MISASGTINCADDRERPEHVDVGEQINLPLQGLADDPDRHSAPSNQRMYSDTPAGGTAFGGLMGAPAVGRSRSKY
jgi:hypothetical protein